ncbi:ATP-binding protein [Halomicroarcula sp. GCM10025709]|uniref:receiver/sensor box histidine kinase n=1 Tax=Haloarcula TaxID=2237 RepID=UPI0024C3D7A9|nr:ATP-binding protein [Halomicroarcula sp. YJ-61-S]
MDQRESHRSDAGSTHVLVVDPSPTRGDRLADRLETHAAIEGYASASVDAAIDRLAWPDIDCLVVRHDGDGFDAVGAAETICEKHPCLPVVLYTTTESTVAQEAVGTAIDEFVDGTSGDRVTELAAAVEDTALDSTAQDDLTTPPLDDPPTPNVDAGTVEELLSAGIDADQLSRLLHKSRLFDTIMESIPVHLYIKDIDARHLYVSTGYFEESLDEFIGNTDPEIGLVADRHARRAHREDEHVIRSGEPVLDKVEYLPMLDQWNLTSKVPWHGPDGEVVGLIGVTRDISARKERQNEVRRQNERLERFANMVSHDLRNPLQLATMRLELARRADDPTQHLDDVDAALQRMDALIEDVLALARQGKRVVNPEPIDLDEVLHMAWNSVDAPDATFVLASSPGTVLGDEGRLRQLVANVFRNAIEHAGTAVTISVGRLPDETGFYIEDDGPGFPDPDDSELFEAGYTTSETGTGFGLSIVAEIADAHDWTVRATTGDEGGARLEFTGVDRPSFDSPEPRDS